MEAVGGQIWAYPAIVAAVALDSIVPMAPGETVMILAARFIPGGRTATTFAAGTLEMPWRRFLAVDAVAAALWATYVALLGYFGGSAFEESLWRPLLVAGGVAILVATVAELVRRAKLA